ncbi:MAG: hypothetical protein PHR26_00930 [Candidatus ainarchaeum sp.]|nr:hypothetical protein [Candidatus ainarchaeum sp.]MDD3976111.1 hypothetical protein [Candidatus ainarchaeum sp.]
MKLISQKELLSIGLKKEEIKKLDYKQKLILQKAIYYYGFRNINVFLKNTQNILAYKQNVSGKDTLSKKVNILDTFSKEFLEIQNKFENKNLKIKLSTWADKPFGISINIYNAKDTENAIAKFNFDIFLDKSKKTHIILGNIQGLNGSFFKHMKNKSILNEVIKIFKETYPSDRLKVLNPKHHKGYNKPFSEKVFYNLIHQGKINSEEAYLFNIGVLPKEKTKHLQKLVTEEINAIKTRGRGMHVAAYKKEGFKRSKKKLWKLRK